MTGHPDAILFELEGVLAHTERARASALRAVAASRGLDVPAQLIATASRLSSHNGAAAILAAATVPHDATDIDLLAFQVDAAFATELAGGIQLADGAQDTVARLASATRLGIVSRAGRTATDAILRLASLEYAFECVITSDDAIAPKPSPAPFERAITRLSRRRNVRNSHIVALESSPQGIEGALACALHCIAIGSVELARDGVVHADRLLDVDLSTIAFDDAPAGHVA